MSAIRSASALGRGPFSTPDPFLFCVYHKDAYPAAKNDRCEAPRRGNGHDFGNPSGWSMYHGEKVPGFPRHPHRGFETLTATVKGLVDHTDSLGNGGRYGGGDNQWMTAGKGIVHSEMFPLVHKDKGNPTQFFQIWLNLPPASKMVEPNFVMHWAEDVPQLIETKTASSASGGETLASRVRVFAGEIGGKKGLPPPADSWAADPTNHVAVWAVELHAEGAAVTLPACNASVEVNRALYFCDGDAVEVDGQLVDRLAHLDLDPAREVTVVNRGGGGKGGKDGSGPTMLLLLQGRPIGAPVAQHGPFVMNTRQEIQQAFADYQRTEFGGWPWDQEVVVFPRTKGRFASLNGNEILPPSAAPVDTDEL